MATTIEVYDQYTNMIMGSVSLLTSDLRMALVDSNYTFSASHTSFSADVSADEVTGTGYTAGGAALTGKTITSGVFDAADTGWLVLTATFRRGILYAVGTIDGVANPVLFSVLFDDSPADIIIVSSDFSPAWNALGIYSITGPTT